MSAVEWEKIFATEKAKIEAGEDPEGDGLTDVSDSEDEEETEPWHAKDAAARSLSRAVMLRTEGGAALRLPARSSEVVGCLLRVTPCRLAACARGVVRLTDTVGIWTQLAGEEEQGAARVSAVARRRGRRHVRSVIGRDALVGRGAREESSGSDSDVGYEDEMEPPTEERHTARPVDHGRKDFYRHYGGAGGGDAGGTAASEDIAEVEVEEEGVGVGRGGKAGREGAVVHRPVAVDKGGGAKAAQGRSGGGAGWGSDAKKAQIRAMLEVSNKGKSSGRVLDERPEALELVQYDRRLANYMQSVESSSGIRKRYSTARFLVFETVHDLALLDFPKARFWISLLMLVLLLEARMHVHYAATFAWLFLYSRPLYMVAPGMLRWEIRYSPMSTTSQVEIGALCSGPTAVFALWLCVAGLVWGLSKIVRIDSIIYRFVGLLGVLAAGDWVLVLVVDILTLSFEPCSPQWNKNGTAIDSIEARAWLKEAGERCSVDALRLWFHFRFNEGNGNIAPVVIVIIYAGMLCLMLVILYTYFLNIHADGRILDLYRRLTCKEGTLFLPLDVEVSPQELLAIISAARRWRGHGGGRRRLIVTDIEMEYLSENLVGGIHEPAGESVKRVLTHLGLYTCPSQVPCLVRALSVCHQ
jgi:hypothetical protein